MNIWLHNILCDFFYPFKTQGRIILGRTVLSIHSILTFYLAKFRKICIKSVYYIYKDLTFYLAKYRKICIKSVYYTCLYIDNIQILYRYIIYRFYTDFSVFRQIKRQDTVVNWLSCCLTPSILFNFRYKKIKTYMANLFTYFDGALPQLFIEMKVCWKAFLKGGTRR